MMSSGSPARIAVPALLWMALLAVAPLSAQSSDEDRESPRVERIVFRGTENISAGELRESLETKATTCRGLLLRPFCWVTDSGIFEDRRYLDREELQRDELRVRVFYWRRGFREAQVASEVTPRGGGVVVTFTVDEGPPTLVRAADVDQTLPILGQREIAEADLPEPGTPLNLLQLDSARVRLLAALWERGYADAAARDSVVLADNGQSAAVNILLEPGRLTTIDEIVIRGNEDVSDRTIRRSLELRPGQLYRRSDVVASQRRLYQSDLFRQALVTVADEPDTAKQVLVTVREAPFRAVRAGVGFNTVEFVQTEARLTRYNWFGGARRLDVRAAVGNILAPQLYDKAIFGSAVPDDVGDVEAAYLDPTWQLSADFTQPWFFSPRNSFGLGVFARRRSVLGIVIDRGYGASASFTRRLAEDVPASLTYRFEVTTVEAGDVYYCVNFGVCRVPTIDALRGSQRLSPAGFTLFADRANDPLAPTGGYTARLDAEHASEFTASDFRYNRAAAEATRYLEIGPGVLAGHVRAGWVRPLKSTAEAVGVQRGSEAILHPRKRFYAGGARSVRGYGENQLGPRILTIAPGGLLEPSDTSRGPGCTQASIASGSCDPNIAPSEEFQPRPLGGNSVLEASVEYRFPIWGALGGAVFVDAATVGDRNLNIPTGGRSAVTPGFGVRYLSPVGPIRVDLGIRPTLTEDLPVVTQITEDGETRLVQLRTLKEYDPVETSGGTLGQIINRLQLHLSIGEAF